MHSVRGADRRGIAAIVVVVGLLGGSAGLVQAQSDAGQSNPSVGVISGTVMKCVNNTEQPLAGAKVSDGGGIETVMTDQNGNFGLALVPGQYNIVADGGPAGSGTVYSVPVIANQNVNIGNIDVGTSVFGCGAPPPQPAAPAAATAAPTAAPTAVPTTAPTAAPTAVPTSATTAAPADTGTTPDMTTEPGSGDNGDTTPSDQNTDPSTGG